MNETAANPYVLREIENHDFYILSVSYNSGGENIKTGKRYISANSSEKALRFDTLEDANLIASIYNSSCEDLLHVEPIKESEI
jgi:hypothetical protein